MLAKQSMHGELGNPQLVPRGPLHCSSHEYCCHKQSAPVQCQTLMALQDRCFAHFTTGCGAFYFVTLPRWLRRSTEPFRRMLSPCLRVRFAMPCSALKALLTSRTRAPAPPLAKVPL